MAAEGPAAGGSATAERTQLLAEDDDDGDHGSAEEGSDSSEAGLRSSLPGLQGTLAGIVLAATALALVAAAAAFAPATGLMSRQAQNYKQAERRQLQLLINDQPPGSEPLTMTFYMYRAQDDQDYPFENLNAADLPGVFWYLHNEVVQSVPRKFNVSRILRWRITMRVTDKFFEKQGKQFGPFVAFDAGRCTVPNCDHIWKTWGFNIGCQPLDSSVAAYMSPFRTHVGGKKCPPNCNDGLWYSLPGACPASAYNKKTGMCKQRMPGGRCKDVADLNKPGRDCTYFAEFAGDIRLDELVGIKEHQYSDWWMKQHNREYVRDLDKGVGTTFWNYKKDPERCLERMNKLQDIFQKRYPQYPVTYGEPPCDITS